MIFLANNNATTVVQIGNDVLLEGVCKATESGHIARSHLDSSSFDPDTYFKNATLAVNIFLCLSYCLFKY